MLVIRTGKPGHGKTLNTIREVDQKAHAEGRVVYFHNINGLKPDQLQAQWFEFEDPEKWFELPNDSIIVVDEAQGWFGARDPRARPPEHITRFETMRHQGHEVHLVTQDPRYLDVHLRRLCNTHIHYWRVFKSAQLLRFESEVVVEKVELKTSFKDADKKSLRLDKRYFGAYTSSNAKHHFQAKVPTKFILAICVLVGAGILVYRAYERYNTEKTALEATSSAPAGSMVDQVRDTVGAFIRPSADTERAAPLTVEQYLGKRVPRVQDLPASAPVYDGLTAPQTFPKPVCIATTDRDLIARNYKRMQVGDSDEGLTGCRCNTQQGTRLEVSFGFCMSVVQNGYFDDTKPDPEPPQAPMHADSPPPALEQAVASGLQSAPKGSSVVVVPYEKGKFLW
ncbi:zonular occludens toxin domain-containing protein [Stutzerimonas chloritidismutans]|uniref:zonular occludens toxin domain-containing protein n=1 Tax=Stutzerimonas chloritidismutans TaxID=203192 RepID=UPI0015CD3453|nr:zonular occludens toxin domain-containing protein [Stutzerimonas chloritidismutans]UEG62397.1 zonular occludens toxin domain-containing protein [Stutzerimonas chloritidismutans]